MRRLAGSIGALFIVDIGRTDCSWECVSMQKGGLIGLTESSRQCSVVVEIWVKSLASRLRDQVDDRKGWTGGAKEAS